MNEPAGFEKWNPAMRGAWRKGFEAAMAGLPCVSPYKDKRNVHGRLTWSRAFDCTWHDGWAAGHRKQQIEAETSSAGQGQAVPARVSCE